MDEVMSEIILLIIVMINLGILAINIKIWTEMVKQRMQETRRGQG